VTDTDLGWLQRHPRTAHRHPQLHPADSARAFEDAIRDHYPETTQVGWLELDTVTVMKEMDPVSWRMAESEWIDLEVSEEQLVTFDLGSTYFWVREVEEYLEESEV
jgi:hypothetical protein